MSSDRLLVQVRIATESSTSDASQLSTPVRRQTRKVPTDAMKAWILVDDGTSLHQAPREPPSGAVPAGVVSAGTHAKRFTQSGNVRGPRAIRGSDVGGRSMDKSRTPNGSHNSQNLCVNSSADLDCIQCASEYAVDDKQD